MLPHIFDLVVVSVDAKRSCLPATVHVRGRRFDCPVTAQDGGGVVDHDLVVGEDDSLRVVDS